MSMAAVLSKLSTCDRKHVGALFVKDGRCIVWGYNGAPPGLPHCSENNHGHGLPGGPSAHPEDDNDWLRGKLEREGCVNATHAEANALAFAARHGISTAYTTLYVTVSPCLDCSRLLIAAGVSTVYYREEYRDGSGRELLAAAGIQCRSL
jgi:dCMP deaminase